VRIKQKLILSVLATGTILLIILGLYWAYSPIKPVSTGLEQAFNPSGDFTLTEDNGKIFHLRDHRGEVVLLFFGYTSCPGVCPMALAKMARARTLLGAAGQKVTTVFVTVDPQRDTSARLKEYLGYFDINAMGLTGTKTQIDKVVHAYNADYEKVPTKSALGYIINHSSIVYLIGKEGKVRYLFHQDDSPEKIAKVIKEMTSSDR
jgi:cytochrome oxidase Cu insertion factor (SCO1/SenC/PrrC family)